MRLAKPFIIHLPESFVIDLKEYLKENPPNYHYKVMYFFYIVHYLAYRMLTAKENETFIKINMQKFKSITVSNIGKYITILENGYFLKVENYVKGERSKGYRINKKYLLDKSIKEIAIDPKTNLFKKVLKYNINRKAHYSRMSEYLRLMNKEFMKLEFDSNSALQFIQNTKSDNFKNVIIHHVAVQHLQDKRLRYFSRSKSNNRLNTNLTSLWKELRPFIVGNYVSIDLKNSQPFFLSILINTINNNNLQHTGIMYDILFREVLKTFGIISLKRILKNNQNQNKCNLVNLSLMFEQTKIGEFYEYLQTAIEGKSRDEIKKMVFQIYYSHNDHYKENKKHFQKVFPYIFEVIEILKRKKYKKLSIFMQQIESYIFIDCIAPELVNSNIIPLTIHDSIIVKKQHEAKALEIMKRVFIEQIGVVPTFEIENIKNPN